MPINSATELVEAIRKLGLLDNAKQTNLERSIQGRDPTPQQVAQKLITHAWLTKYQCDLLFKDRGAELVLGDYQVLDRLNEGGMGQLFKARHRIMDREVAIKATNPDLMQRFKKEIRAIAKLSHPNIITAHDALQVGDMHYLVMEYVNGCSLQELVSKEGPLPVPMACEFIRQSALGLQHAADNGFVHRDIKPANLQMTKDRATIKILDLGLVRMQPLGPGDEKGGLTMAQTMLGTPDFMAPEQFKDARNVTTTADIYSLGCTFYFLLTGRAPFSAADSLADKIVCHTNQHPEPLSQFRHDVPPGVAMILQKMMAKRPDARFQKPVEAAHALAAFCGSRVLTADTSKGGPEPGQPTVSWIPSAPVAPTMDGIANPYSAPTVVRDSVGTDDIPMLESRKRKPRWIGVLFGGIAVSLLLLCVMLVWMRPGAQNADLGTANNKSKGKGEPLLFEEFSKGEGIPEGWVGDSFRIARFQDRFCLESSKTAAEGPCSIRLPPMSLAGDFEIEGAYLLVGANIPGGQGGLPEMSQTLTLLLENSKANVPLPLIISFDGSVILAGSSFNRLDKFVPNAPSTFRLTRKGNKLEVRLREEYLGHKNVNRVDEYDRISIITLGDFRTHYLTKLFNIKIVSTSP